MVKLYMTVYREMVCLAKRWPPAAVADVSGRHKPEPNRELRAKMSINLQTFLTIKTVRLVQYVVQFYLRQHVKS